MDGGAVQIGEQTAYPKAMSARATHDLRFTAAEFERIALAGGFSNVRLELRDGEIVKMSPTYVPHADVHGELYFALKTATAQSDSGLQVMLEVSVSLGDYFQPLPDIVVWDPSVLDKRPTGPMPATAVRIVIEVSDSTLADDLGAKLADYAMAGVPEYWVADIGRARLLLHAQPNGDTYERRETYPFGGAVTALTLPLTLDTSSLIEA